MEYAYIELEKALKKIPCLVDVDGNLLKQLVIDKIHQLDKDVISLILKSPQLKSFFTTKIDDALILDKTKLLSFVQAREFIPNSFTEFTNTVGLSSSSKFIHNSDSIVLDFPYKDCVLLGNQSKEENEGVRQKFFHEVINFQEINKLFTRKVMCDFVKHTITGEEQITSFSPSDNLIIKGNNLVALHTLTYLFQKKVKLIYIDPPYNTESLKFAYNDKFDQATWLVFMKNRLEQAKQLLSEDGVIAIQIDDKQLYSLKLLADQIFGSEKHLNTIAIKMSESSGVKISHVEKCFPKMKEYLLIYYNRVAPILNPITIDKRFENEDASYLNYYTKYITNPSSPPEDWKIEDSSDLFDRLGIKSKEKQNIYKIKNASVFIYRTNNKSFDKITGIRKIITATGLTKINWDGKELLLLSDYLKEYIGDLWLDISTINLNKEGDVSLNNGKKPEKLIHRIISAFTNENDIVLDYHLGSGTTCAVAHKMNRTYIGIEQLDYEENDSIARLKNVIAGDLTGISNTVNWAGGGSFISMKLYSIVDSLLAKIHKAKSKDELKKVIELLLTDEYFIYLGIDSHKKSYEDIFCSTDFDTISLDEQKDTVHKSIDKNNLYVDFDNLHDSYINLSANEKVLNELFYQGKVL